MVVTTTIWMITIRLEPWWEIRSPIWLERVLMRVLMSFGLLCKLFSNLFLLLIVVALQVPPHIQQYRRDVRQEIWRQVGRRDESAPLGLPGGMDAVVVAGAQRSLCMSNWVELWRHHLDPLDPSTVGTCRQSCCKLSWARCGRLYRTQTEAHVTRWALWRKSRCRVTCQEKQLPPKDFGIWKDLLLEFAWSLPFEPMPRPTSLLHLVPFWQEASPNPREVECCVSICNNVR